MSIPSLYASGDDEEELFRLTAPDDHPDAADDSVAKLEEQSLASSHYDDDQAEVDELAEATGLGVAIQSLTDQEREEVLRLVEEIQNRRESNDSESSK